MQRISSLAFVLFMLLAPAANAASSDDTVALAGNWINESYDGVFTQLEIEASGKFVFREMHSSDLRRSYMCGKLTDNGDALSLLVKQFKERTSSGEITQAVGDLHSNFSVQSRSDNRLVLKIDSRTVVFEKG